MTPLRTQYDEVAKDADAPYSVDSNLQLDGKTRLIGMLEMYAEADAAYLIFCANNFEAALREIERLEAELDKYKNAWGPLPTLANYTED